MPFAPKIRRDILQALEQNILPALKSSLVPQVLVNDSYDLSPAEYWPIDQEYLPAQSPDPLQVSWNWKKEHMAASRFPYLMFVYEGIADHKIGITTEISRDKERKSGVVLPGAFLLRLPSPCMLYSVPELPRNSTPPISEINVDYKCLCLFIMNQDVRVHLSGTTNLGSFVSHSLQIYAPSLVLMAELYKNELEAEQREVAQAQLFVLMSHLYARLKTTAAPLGNSAWPMLPDHHLSPEQTPSTREQEICQKAIDHIETRLNGNLNRANIAQALYVSPDHLGRVFHASTGVTLMNYVTHRRVEAAKLILSSGSENIAEVASLVGFTNATSFSTAFKRATGVVPSTYRRQHRKIY